MDSTDIRAEYEAMELQYYTPREEIANAVTHGIGAPVAFAFMIYFLVAATTLEQIAAALFMCLAAMLVYITSCVYHALTDKERKRVARKFDHANIGLLVTACSVPYMLMLSSHYWNYVSLALCLALCALDAVLCFVNLMKFKRLGVIFNILIGALGLSAFCVNFGARFLRARFTPLLPQKIQIRAYSVPHPHSYRSGAVHDRNGIPFLICDKKKYRYYCARAARKQTVKKRRLQQPAPSF